MEEPSEVVSRLRTAFGSRRTRPLEWRIEQLARLEALLVEHEDEWIAAMVADVGKPEIEGWLSDLRLVVREMAGLRARLDRLVVPRRVRTPITSQPARSMLVPEPLGVVLVIGAWNYPLQLLFMPGAGALAAGNALVLKPSELAPRTAELVARLVPQYLDADAVAVVEGGASDTTELLRQRFDHIFFTGSARVGRVVMEAAARHLTPVTLELGGKSPAIVDATADVELTARRLAWGKFVNAGQTCVAPDYALVDRAVVDDLVAALGRTVQRFYGRDPRRSTDFGRIVNDHHLARLQGLLAGGRAVIGGEVVAAERYVAPTVLVDVDLDAPVMQDEIFGPILPIVPVDDIDAAIAFVGERPKPLALYVFAGDEAVVDRVIEHTSAGGVTVNGTLHHVTSPYLPFGGVGDSGMGTYHGDASFDVFTHHKPVLWRRSSVDPPLAYPPYTKRKRALLDRLLR
jgi:aldehyde dehydrogenase (NAD+)